VCGNDYGLQAARVEILVGVLSSYANADRREAVRDTWFVTVFILASLHFNESPKMNGSVNYFIYFNPALLIYFN
jgi:hypothetical protein